MARKFAGLAVGETRSFGSHEVTGEEIRAFGRRYDPQPFHVDEDAARASPFGGLVASGWHTAAVTMRLLVEHFLAGSRSRGALGVDDLRFRDPVRPGTVLSVTLGVREVEPWDEDRELLHLDVETTDADGEAVLTMVPLVLWDRE